MSLPQESLSQMLGYVWTPFPDAGMLSLYAPACRKPQAMQTFLLSFLREVIPQSLWPGHAALVHPNQLVLSKLNLWACSGAPRPSVSRTLLAIGTGNLAQSLLQFYLLLFRKLAVIHMLHQRHIAPSPEAHSSRKLLSQGSNHAGSQRGAWAQCIYRATSSIIINLLQDPRNP